MYGSGPSWQAADSSAAALSAGLPPFTALGEPSSSEVPPAEAEALDPERTWEAPTGAGEEPVAAAAASTLGASSPRDASLVTASQPPRNSPPTKQ